jgi:predicted nucleic acid-binding Zn ribbon protein
MSRRRAPEPFADVLRDALGRAAPDTLLARVQALWAEVAGGPIAAHAAPGRERGGVVWIECESSIYAHELQLMAPELAAALNARLKGLQVRELRFEVKSP